MTIFDFLTWKFFFGDRRLYLDAIKMKIEVWYGGPDPNKTIAKLIVYSI